MFLSFLGNKAVIGGVALAGALAYHGITVHKKNVTIEELQHEIALRDKEISIKEAEVSALKEALDRQSAEIEKVKVDYAKKIDAYKRHKIVKYRELEKKSDDCEDIKSALDAVRRIKL